MRFYPKSLPSVLGFVAVGILLIAASTAAFVVLTKAGRDEPVAYYTVVADDTIALATSTGRWEWTRVTDVNETNEGIRIQVRTWSLPFYLGSAVAKPLELTVHLDRPLGSRNVYDAFGEIRRR
jgi:hypothetical protein